MLRWMFSAAKIVGVLHVVEPTIEFVWRCYPSILICFFGQHRTDNGVATLRLILSIAETVGVLHVVEPTIEFVWRVGRGVPPSVEEQGPTPSFLLATCDK